MTLVFLDTETAGLDDSVHPLLEIAWAVEDDVIHDLRVPHDPRQVPATVWPYNGYIDRELFDVRRWAKPHELRLLWARTLRKATLVAANPSFDERFLLAFARANLDLITVDPWLHRKVDIESYAMPIFGWAEPRSLTAIANELGEGEEDKGERDHSARGDVDLLRRCYRRLEVMGEEMRQARAKSRLL